MQQDPVETGTHARHIVAVIGAGPAGIYAARKLAESGVGVVLINRDIKPGGLAEYGIYHDKHKMKEGLRKQFRRILTHPDITYFGGIQLGQHADLTLEDLEGLGCSAILFTIGAQGTRKLGLTGEDVQGVFHAKDLVFHFNQLPPFASKTFDIGKRVGIIGMGNVMIDIAHWLVCDKKVDEVVVIARRGPSERAYTDKEMREIIQALDQDDLTQEMARIQQTLQDVGQDVAALQADIMEPLQKAEPIDSPTRFKFRFLCSPTQVVSDENGRMCGVEVEYNKLVAKGETLRPQGTGEKVVLDLDTLVYAIGDQVDPNVGLPYEWGQYIVPPEPHPSIPDRARYEVYNPKTKSIREGWFVGGWARIASDGLVGKARADGETAVEEVLAYLANQPTLPAEAKSSIVEQLLTTLNQRQVEYVTYSDVQKLESIEQKIAAEQKRDFFKFNTNQEMLEAIKS